MVKEKSMSMKTTVALAAALAVATVAGAQTARPALADASLYVTKMNGGKPVGRYVYSVNRFNDFIWLASKDGVGLANRRLPLLYKGLDLDILTQPGQHSRNLRIWLVRVLLSKVWSNFGAAQG